MWYSGVSVAARAGEGERRGIRLRIEQRCKGGEAHTERGMRTRRLEHPLGVHPRELSRRQRLIEGGVADGPPAAGDEMRDAEEDQPQEHEALEAIPAVDLCAWRATR